MLSGQWRQTRFALGLWMRWMVLAWLCLSWLPEVAVAQVPRIQGQGTAASAMSNAFSAQADDPRRSITTPPG